jgi:thymidine kinase
MSLELIIGPMFAGKSSAIMSIVKRYNAIRYPILVLKSAVDNRYSNSSEIVNHDLQRLNATAVNVLIPQLSNPDYQRALVIIIEEAQFFEDLYEFVLIAVEHHKKNVIVVGLDGDSERKPFGQVLSLIPLADKLQKITSYCTICSDGTPALFSFCAVNKATQVQVGAIDKYVPLCRKHYLENKL